ncbi:hypothetical protein LY78DRAFT_658012 [Colletotrichum sublineola]|nr:hypothetical protein LY78DRAFT_658012 [Colletotrichum sublineola]
MCVITSRMRKPADDDDHKWVEQWERRREQMGKPGDHHDCVGTGKRLTVGRPWPVVYFLVTLTTTYLGTYLSQTV